MNFKTCMVIGALLTAVPTAYAQLKPPAPDNEVRLKEVSVSATRTEKELADVPAAVTVFTADDIDRGLVQRIDDLIRYEPGVSVRSDPSRFGPTGFNIRGLENNRVLIQVDGVRMQDFFSFSV